MTGRTHMARGCRSLFLPRRGMALATALFGWSLWPAHADALDDAIAALVQDAPYADAREKLLAAGWEPMAFDMTTLSGRCSFREEICSAYPEAEDCSGTGMGFCLFRFEAGDGRKLSVTTAGEEFVDLVVYGWKAE